MAMGPRLDLRQSQSLVMTPQLQQAIKLLALSNLEIEAFIGDALEANPLLDIGEAAPAPDAVPGDDIRQTTLETSPIDQLIGEGRAGEDQPLDIDASAIDTDRDTGDSTGADATAQTSEPFEGESGLSGTGEAPAIEQASDAAETLAQHLHDQIGANLTQVTLLGEIFGRGTQRSRR